MMVWAAEKWWENAFHRKHYVKFEIVVEVEVEVEVEELMRKEIE
jgi:hypothetical protein